MEIVIQGHNLPGRTFRDAGVPIHEVHVALQVRQIPDGLVPGDAGTATWRLEVRTSLDADGAIDFAGPAVHGRRGDRFLYLTWGNLGSDGSFAMFRRAKLLFADIDPELVQAALDSGDALRATVDLTDAHGGPRCARVRPPALIWSVS